MSKQKRKQKKLLVLELRILKVHSTILLLQ